MKQIAIILLFIALPTIGIFAQWNEKGNNKSTGNLSTNNGIFQTNEDGILVEHATKGHISIIAKDKSSYGGLYLDQSKGNIVLRNKNQYTLHLTAGGRVGIGTDSPQSLFDVKGESMADSFKTHDGIFKTNEDGILVEHATKGYLTIIAKDKSSSGGLYLDQTKGNIVLRNKNQYTLHLTAGGRVGIGTDSPQSLFDVKGKSMADSFRTHDGIFETNEDGILVEHATKGYLTIIAKDKSSYGGLYLDQSKGNIVLRNKNQYSLHLTGAGRVGIGTDAPASLLDVNGDIKAKELKVDGIIYAKSVKVRVDAGADYVFDPDYKLRDLSEVEAFVRENKHLPEIQSEKDMQANGVDMNEFQIKLLQKVEELTLYVIQQNKRIEELEIALENK